MDDFFDDEFDWEDGVIIGGFFDYMIEDDEEEEKRRRKLEEQEQMETEQDLFPEYDYDEMSRE